MKTESDELVLFHQTRKFYIFPLIFQVVYIFLQITWQPELLKLSFNFKELSKERKIIILTDPDYPGLRIRNIINQEIPNAYNAFVSRDKASNGKKLGVAETPIEEIVRALENARVFSLEKEEKLYTLSDLYELGLVGQINSSFLREKVYKRYNLGYGNAKTLIKRLSSLGINKDELKEYLKEIINENSK